MKNVELAYIAGFFDGEGDCGVSFPKNRLGNRNPMPRARITQNDRKTLDWIQNLYGFGSVVVKDKGTDRKNQCHALRFSYRTARKFLTSVEPFLQLKQEKVCAILDEFGRLSLD